ncbi:hypothetical protein [Stutzerimonas stutzeri]|uniref:hypothetical protein n=1 Tax=Stutzerimonas stutzeri TaxID=316 RepID=UPI001F24CF35|nr:hypothetical protein [Stutzerimonas stutzeri]MCF6754817.1 hypothetical protein [Stutzerimonas stutzeri]
MPEADLDQVLLSPSATTLAAMKTCLSLCLLLLISLALPVNGLVAAERMPQPCTMQPADTQHGAMQHAADQHADQHGDHGHDGNSQCKSGHQCKTGCLLQFAVPRADVDAPSSRLIVYLPDFIPSRNGADVWRPPCA